jgi:hypothetical protein
MLAISASLVAADVNDKADINIKRETLELLDKSMSSYHKKLISSMPDNVRLHLSKLVKPRSIYDLKDADSLRWIQEHVRVGANDDLIKAVDGLVSDLAVSGDKIHGDDIASIFESSFFALWNKESFNLEEPIVKIAISWREKSTPPQQLSPDGLNRIEWRWQLDVESRESGVLHVGIDEKKRTFICYENTIGLYLPEGETLERIYREIVQDPNMAGQFVGKGRKQHGRETEK